MRSLAIICTIILVAGCTAPKMATYPVPKSPSVLGRLSVPVDLYYYEPLKNRSNEQDKRNRHVY